MPETRWIEATGRLYRGIYERRGKDSNLRGLTPTPQLGHLRALVVRLYNVEYKVGEGYSITGLAIRTGAKLFPRIGNAGN